MFINPYVLCSEFIFESDSNQKQIISEEEIEDLPEVGCGGILADDMGLGKTLQCISLIATNSGFKDKPEGDGPTLIIAPLTVIGNWVGQIGDHCAKDAFKILVYHGPNREKDLDVIKVCVMFRSHSFHFSVKVKSKMFSKFHNETSSPSTDSRTTS